MPWGGAITTYSDRTVVIDGENVYIQGASSRANVEVTDANYFARFRVTADDDWRRCLANVITDGQMPVTLARRRQDGPEQTWFDVHCLAVRSLPHVVLGLGEKEGFKCTWTTVPLDKWHAEDKKLHDQGKLERCRVLTVPAAANLWVLGQNESFTRLTHVLEWTAKEGGLGRTQSSSVRDDPTANDGWRGGLLWPVEISIGRQAFDRS